MIKKAYCQFFSTIVIPEVKQADGLICQGKFKTAIPVYERALEIFKSAKMHDSSQYGQVAAKYVGCNFLAHNYAKVNKFISQGLSSSNLPQGIDNYFKFANLCSLLAMRQSIDGIQHPLKPIVLNLLSDNQCTDIQSREFPVLKSISDNLNARVSYQRSLMGLLDRNHKKLSKEGEQKIIFNQMPSELALLFHLGLLLNHKHESVSSITYSNGCVNQILESYEKEKKNEVYKPLSYLAISLICQKHYMSAEGMIGHIKSGDSGLFYNQSGSLNSTEDHNLVNNIYRMLVTRANHQSYEEAWAKENPVNFGKLVAQRIISAPLHNWATDSLII